MNRVNLRSLLAAAVLVGALLLLTGCHPGHERYDMYNPAGFWWGLWHGAIVIVTLVGSFFSEYWNIYEVYNTGFFYNLGFLLGVGGPIGGGFHFMRD